MKSLRKELRRYISLVLLKFSLDVMPDCKFKAQLVFTVSCGIHNIDDDLPSWLSALELQKVLVLYNQKTNSGIKVLKHIAVLKNAPLDKYNLKWCKTFLQEIANNQPK